MPIYEAQLLRDSCTSAVWLTQWPVDRLAEESNLEQALSWCWRLAVCCLMLMYATRVLMLFGTVP